MTRSQRIVASLRRNALQGIPTMFIIMTLGFFVMRLAPGDAADFIAAQAGSATEQTTSALRHRFGLDLPAVDQLFNYYFGLVHGSLGISPSSGQPVTELIVSRLPGTLLLMSVAILFALAIGMLAGTVMAMTRGRLPDRILSIVSLGFYSVPAFWIGLMLIILFSVELGWLPSGGSQTIGSQQTGWAALADRSRYIVLPALTMAFHYIAIYARLTRAAVLEARRHDYVRTAIAKGLTHGAVIRRHVLRNALIPISTYAGLHVVGMLGGAVVVETVFSWPGMGRLAYEAIQAREYPVLLGILLTSSAMVIVANALVDVFQAVLDPRIKVR